MKQEKEINSSLTSERRQRLKVIVIAHLVIAIAFFAAAFLWGKFS